MDASNTHFTNSEVNPARPWFRRMVDQLELNVYNSGFNWADIEMSIVMSSYIWECVSRVYAYSSYYDSDKNVYLITCTDYIKMQHKEYLNQCALPIRGRIYPVILDNDVSDIHFDTYVSGQFNEKFSGCIQNVNCYFD